MWWIRAVSAIIGGSDGKESAWNAGDLGSIPWLGRSPGEGNGYSSILAWRIPWIEEPGGLLSMGSQEVTHDWVTIVHTHCHYWFGSSKVLDFYNWLVLKYVKYVYVKHVKYVYISYEKK